MQLEYIIKCDAYQIYMDLSRLVYGCIWYQFQKYLHIPVKYLYYFNYFVSNFNVGVVYEFHFQLNTNKTNRISKVYRYEMCVTNFLIYPNTNTQAVLCCYFILTPRISFTF